LRDMVCARSRVLLVQTQSAEGVPRSRENGEKLIISRKDNSVTLSNSVSGDHNLASAVGTPSVVPRVGMAGKSSSRAFQRWSRRQKWST
jgi:hypothetical protein